jgi:mRNA interferase RelE/StbE
MTGQPYSISWSPSALRDLRRVPERIATAVVEFIYGSLADNPQRVGRDLRLELVGNRGARRGDYGVIYRIDDTARVVYVVAVDHRVEIYRPR